MGLELQCLREAFSQNMGNQIADEPNLPEDKRLSSEAQKDISEKLGLFNGQSVIKIRGTEPTIRVIGVHLQNYFERALATLLKDRTIEAAIGIIHTKEATTSLQNPAGEISDAFLKKLPQEVKDSPDAMKTVTRRTESSRDLISLGSDIDFKLYVAFSEGGFERAQQIYKTEVADKSKNPNLVSYELTHKADQFNPNEIGATYVMKANDEQHLVLSLKAEQVKDAGAENESSPSLKEWTYWFGNMEEPEIKARYRHITDFLKEGDLKITLP